MSDVTHNHLVESECNGVCKEVSRYESGDCKWIVWRCEHCLAEIHAPSLANYRHDWASQRKPENPYLILGAILQLASEVAEADNTCEAENRIFDILHHNLGWDWENDESWDPVAAKMTSEEIARAGALKAAQILLG